MSYNGSSNSVGKKIYQEDTMTNKSAFSQLPMIKNQVGGTAIPNTRRHLLSQGARKLRNEKLRKSLPNTDRNMNNIRIKKNNSISDNMSVLS